MFYNEKKPKRVDNAHTKNRESVEAFLRKSRKSKIIDYANAVGLTGNFLCLSGWARKRFPKMVYLFFVTNEMKVIAV